MSAPACRQFRAVRAEQPLAAGTLLRQHTLACSLVDMLTGPRTLELLGCAHCNLSPRAYAWSSCDPSVDSRGAVLQLYSCAQASFYDVPSLTVTGTSYGTVPYRSHQSAAHGSNGVPDDLWSVATIVLEAGSGVAATPAMEWLCAPRTFALMRFR